MTTKDIEQLKNEYMKKINAILIFKLENGFTTNIPDVIPTLKMIRKNGFLSPNQQLEIDNIIEQYGIRW